MRWLIAALLVALLSVDGWGCARPATPVTPQKPAISWCCEDESVSMATCGFDQTAMEAWAYGTCWNAEEVHESEVKPRFEDEPAYCWSWRYPCPDRW